LLDAGATRLQTQYGAYVAAFGGCNWQTDNQVRESTSRRRDGRPYHRESLARARRTMARRGWMESNRFFPGQRPHPRARPSSHGTTAKAIRWKVLGLKNPTTRAEVRHLQRLQEVRPRYAAAVALQPRPPTPKLDPELAHVIEEAREAFDRLERAREHEQDARTLRALAARGPPEH
jgi:hypothetical protein